MYNIFSPDFKLREFKIHEVLGVNI